MTAQLLGTCRTQTYAVAGTSLLSKLSLSRCAHHISYSRTLPKTYLQM